MVKSYQNSELLLKASQVEGFKGYPAGFWILGVRSKSDAPDQFDDKFYLFKAKEFIMVYTGTTNPGLSILKGGFKEYNSKGAAVAVADHWFYDLWTPGKHKGKIDALLQVGPILLGRDGDMDALSEDDKNQEWRTDTGINHHPATYKLAGLIRVKIGGWSAGCQVVNDDKKYGQMIGLTKTQKRISYCLLREF